MEAIVLRQTWGCRSRRWGREGQDSIAWDPEPPRWYSGKESTCSVWDVSSIPGSGRFPAGGNGNPLQYSCLENPMDRGAWGSPVVHGVSKSQMLLTLPYLSLSGNAKTLWLLTYSLPQEGFSHFYRPSSLVIPNSSGPPCIFSFIHLPCFPLTFPFLSSLAPSFSGSKYLPLLLVFPSQISSAQSLSCVWLFVTPWIAAHQASLSVTNAWSSLKPMSIQSVMPSNHLILCHPLLLLPPIPPSIRVFSSESTLRMRWPTYWSFSFSISPSISPDLRVLVFPRP